MAGIGTFLGGLGSGAIGGAVVNLTLNDTQFQAGLNEAQAKTQGAGSTMQNFGKVAAVAFAAAGTAVVAFAADAFNAFREAQVVQTELERATGDLAEEYTNLAEAQALHLGFSDEDIKQSIIILDRFKLTNTEVAKAIPLLEDYARATGKTVAEAAQILGSALLGNTRGLRKMGIDFEATGDVAADTATILDALSESVGGAADAYAETAEGQIARANQQWDEAKETFGSFVSDAILPLIDAMPALNETARDAGTVWGTFANLILEEAAPAVEEARRSIHHFAGMAGKDLREWGRDVVASFHDVIFDLSNMDSTFDVTRREFIKGSNAMAARARELAHAMRNIADEKWVNEDYIKFLSDQGPEWLVGFSRLTESEQRKAQKAWENSTEKVNDAKGSLDDITGALGNLDRKKATAEVEVHYSWSGIDPGTLPGLSSGKG